MYWKSLDESVDLATSGKLTVSDNGLTPLDFSSVCQDEHLQETGGKIGQVFSTATEAAQDDTWLQPKKPSFPLLRRQP